MPTNSELSLCIIARDEAAFLKRCLVSARNHVDEIIVVDTGSTDATIDVAREAGAHVESFGWCDDFSVARNVSLEAASGDWVLVLDCDEVLAEEDWVKIRSAVSSGQADGYRMTTRNYADDPHRLGFQKAEGDYPLEEKRYAGWFPTTKARLFRRREGVQFEGAVHELVEASIEALGGKIADLGVPVHHYGYVEKERPTALYADAARAKAERAPDHPSAHYELALALRDDDQLEAANAAIERCLELFFSDGADGGPYVTEVLALLVAGDLAARSGNDEGAAARYASAIAADKNSFHAMNNLGTIKMKQGKFDEAERLFKRARKRAPNVPAIEENLKRVKAAQSRKRPGEGGKLTLCMIAKNEAERLPKCLESVQGLVDEIVVVDTGSTDRTVEIAASFGAKTGYFEWCDNWSMARNVSIELATGDWILWLDPDDVLPKEMHGKIRDAMARGLGKKKAYFFVLDDRGYEPVNCLQLRLFPNVSGVAFSQPVHEQVTPSLANLGITCELTDIRVVHTGYTTPEVVREKQERYHRIMVRWLETHPEDYIVRSHVAQTRYIWGELDEAIVHYRRIIDDSACHEDHNLVIETTARLFLGRCLMRQGNYQDALEELCRAHELDEQYAMTNLTIGECHTRLEEPAKALEALEQAAKYEDQLTFAATDMIALRYGVRFFRGQNLEAMGQLEAAAEAYGDASTTDLKRTGALGALSVVLRKLGRTDDAADALDRALEIEPDNAKHVFNRGTYHLEAGEEDAAQRLFVRAIELNPDMHEPYLNLGYMARRRGDAGEAERQYRLAASFEAGQFDANSNLGHLLIDLERYPEAREAFEIARAERTGLLDIDLGLCASLCGVEAFDVIPGLLSGILRVVYDDQLAGGLPSELDREAVAQLLAESGRMLIEKGIIPCARLAYLGAHLADPRSVQYGLQLAEIHTATGQPWRAVQVYESLIQSFPTEPELYRKLGACYQAMDAHESAALCAEQVVALSATEEMRST